MKNKKNSGAAMVTVLIAVTFISIIASSLLYMTYLNYLTKSVRIYSSDNFYTDEFALDEITSSIQQSCMKDAADNDIKTIDKALESVRAACGVTGYNPASKEGSYSPAALQAMLRIASSDASITVDTAATGANYVETDNSVTLKGVQITSISNPKYVGDQDTNYRTNIVTDIVINMPKDNATGPDVNDFSIITDQPLTITNDRAGNTIWSGYIYIKGDSSYALKVDGGRLLSCLSPLAAIDGNLIIEESSAMTVSGKMIVDGDITVKKNSVLIVTGEIICTGTIKKEGDASGNNKGYIRGESNITKNSSVHLPNHTSATGLTNDIFAKHLVLNNGTSTIDMYNGNGSPEDPSNPLPICQMLLTDSGIQNYVKTGKTATISAADQSYTVEYRTLFNRTSDTLNGGADFAGMLCITYGNPTTQLKQNIFGSTVIGLTPIVYSERSSTRMSKLPDEGYELCKNTLCDSSAGFGRKYKNIELGGENTNGSTGPNDIYDMIEAIKKFNAGDTSYKVVAYDAKTGAVSSTTGGVADPDSITVDDVTRYAVSHNGKNYVPVGYFLAPETKSIIADYFSLIYDADNTPKPSASYSNWDKQ